MVRQLNATIDGHLYQLQVEPENYNGHTMYYVLNEDLGKMFHYALPDNLVLIENENGFTCSPRLSEMEGGYIAQQIWQAIQESGKNNPA